MGLRETIQSAAHNNMHLVATACLLVLVVVVISARSNIGLSIRMASLIYSAIVLIITYFGMIDFHMMSNPGVGNLISWVFICALISPQLIYAILILYSNAIGYNFPNNTRSFIKFSIIYAVLIAWSWFVVTGIDTAG